MGTRWAEISITAPNELVERLADFLTSISSSGVSIENREVDTFSIDAIEETPSKTVKSYFPDDGEFPAVLEKINAHLRDEAYSGISGMEPRVTLIDEEDWANNWKAYFKPARIGRRMVIKPTWESYPAKEDDIVLEIDPGMAFGTGTHPTTRLCLEALERIYDRRPPYEGLSLPLARVLDVGTGSGILAVAAAKLGARQVIAVDIDPLAVEVARETSILNQTGDAVEVSTTPLSAITGKFQVILANILAEDLVRLAPDLISRLEAGGSLVLSGILAEREAFVKNGFAPFPLEHVETVQEGEWVCIVYRGR
ncbi:MAG: 50S ribosomal protein L11 methyltransferase [Geobacter sp.]|nr:50S ribosomal protein L11 methyltransferase [Geobacter sp.]